MRDKGQVKRIKNKEVRKKEEKENKKKMEGGRQLTCSILRSFNLMDPTTP